MWGTSVLDRRFGEKHVHYSVLDGKYCKHTVENNVLEGYLAYMFESASGRGRWKNRRKYCKISELETLSNMMEWFYGDKCVNYCALKETIAYTCKHIQRTRDLGDFV